MQSILPPEVCRLEQEFGRWTAQFSRLLPSELKPLAFCGPASFREPEIDDCWHPRFIGRSQVSFFCVQIIPLLKTALGGVRRFLLNRFGSIQYFSNPTAVVIGITPRSICTVRAGRVETVYAIPEDVSAMSWIVFDPAGRESGYSISRLVIIQSALTMLVTAIRVSLQRNVRSGGGFLACMLTVRWILGLQWAILWMLKIHVGGILQEVRPKKMFCVHETFPWARLLWDESRRQGIVGVTIQHASISRTKLWYFPTIDERQAGMALPDEFYVFTTEDQALLQPFFPNTQFLVGCGPRYIQWRDRPLPPQRNNRSTAPVLLVTSVPWWDNEIVLASASRLLQDHFNRRALVVRFHPLAVLPRRSRRWVRRKQQSGQIEISTRTLAEDLDRAGVVLGMNSTVIQEAVSQGLPAVVVESDDILSFASMVGLRIPITQVGWDLVEREIDRVLADPSLQRTVGRNILGLEAPPVRVTV